MNGFNDINHLKWARHQTKKDIKALSAETEYRVHKDKKSAIKRDVRAWPLCVQNIALLIFVLTQFHREPVLQYLHFTKRRCKNLIEDDEMFSIFESWFSATDAEQLGKNCEEAGLPPKKFKHLRAAKVFVAEWKLENWTATQNANLGIAPSTRSTLKEFERICQTTKVNHKLQRAQQGDSTQRQWAVRWRRKWKVKMGKIHARECIPIPTMLAKAIAINLNIVCNRDPNPRPTFWSAFRGHCKKMNSTSKFCPK
jgi:hypothetical protein